MQRTGWVDTNLGTKRLHCLTDFAGLKLLAWASIKRITICNIATTGDFLLSFLFWNPVLLSLWYFVPFYCFVSFNAIFWLLLFCSALFMSYDMSSSSEDNRIIIILFISYYTVLSSVSLALFWLASLCFILLKRKKVELSLSLIWQNWEKS